MATASAHTTLQDELKLINCLIDLMKQEQQFLVAANSDGLDTLTPLKTQLVDQLASLAVQRHQCLANDGFAASETGMNAWVVRMSDPSISANWQLVLARTADAKELNRVNGMLINKQLAHNQALINAMRQPAGAADTGFYGPSGQATAVTGKRRLVVG
ncbi:MAG: flagellar protein FlgN [Pseudomonadota bacterium]